MRREVEALWKEVINPNNEDRFYDLLNFMHFVLDGTISKDEVDEVRELVGEPIL